MFALSNLNSMETRIFERFLKFNQFERHSRTIKYGEIQDQKKHSGMWLSQLLRFDEKKILGKGNGKFWERFISTLFSKRRRPFDLDRQGSNDQLFQ